MKYRIQTDTMGEVNVPESAYWSSQTERSIHNFQIDRLNSLMPIEIVHALALLKKSAARANFSLGLLDEKIAEAIEQTCDEIISKKLDNEFPLVIWQTGSGTQTNMNLNEVISNRGTEILGGDFRKKVLIHPNDDVNKGQSSNDTFPTAMNMVITSQVIDKLLPSLLVLVASLKKKQHEFQSVIKIGRTHMQDATPILVSQEFGGYVYMIENNIRQITDALKYCKELAIGGTAVGTGINAHKDFANRCVHYINEFTSDKYGFIESPNKFHALSAKDHCVFLSGAINGLAVNLYKIVSDLRLSACGPRAGIGEYILPENEPGSSIMPGKINPTQIEAMTMVCSQVFGNDSAVLFASSQGQWQLNVFNPMILANILKNIHLLSDSIHSLVEHCIAGIKLNLPVIEHNLKNSLMTVTALNPIIGYENAAKISKHAHEKGISLRESALELALISEEAFDKAMDFTKMV